MIRREKYIKDLDKGLLPYVTLCAKWGMTPASMFGMSVVVSLLSAIFISAGPEISFLYLLGALGIILRYIISRAGVILMCEYAMNSPGNIFAAELHVPLSNAIIYLPFMMTDGVSGGLVIAVVILAILVEITSITAVPIVNRRPENGPVTQYELSAVFALIAIILTTGLPAILWVNIILVTMGLFQIATVIKRIRACIS